MLHILLSLPVLSCLLAVFGAYWLFRGRGAQDAGVEQRLDKLDVTVTSLRGVLLIFFLGTLLVANVVVYSLSQTALWQGRFQSVKANEFVLAEGDDQGPYRAALRTENGGVRLTLLDHDGKRRVVLGIAPDGSPSVGVLDADEKPRGLMGLGPDAAIIGMNDRAGRPAMALTVANDGTIVQLVASVEGKPRAAMTYAKGMPILSLHDDSTKASVILSMDTSEKRNFLEFRDEKGVKRLEMGLKNNAPVITSFDAEGKPVPAKA